MKKKQKLKKNSNKIDEKEFWVNKHSFRYKHPTIITIFKAIILALLIALIIYIAICAGTILKCDELKISKDDLIIKFENSTVYDIDGNYLATLSSGTKRKCISLAEMGEYLPKAYIAIEDERFYDHFGVDIKRSAAATFSYILNFGNSTFGGSTITQQVVKNITQDKEDTANRKVKEMAKAIQVEQYLTKEQILELYLNIIFIGGNDINGVELGSKYYFNKSAKELSIAECAYMAGINHAPNAYKPLKTDDNNMQEKIKNRTKTVLGKMLELEYINQEQYTQAVAEVDSGLKFQKGDTQPTTTISYQTEAALEQIINQIMEEKSVTKEMAEMLLYSGGYKIYTTQKTSIQDTVENELKNTKYLLTNGDQKSMATVAIIDHTTGNVLACGAGIGEDKIKTNIGNLNYPTSLKKQTGSCMKPISVIAPGLENGIITGATVFFDGETTFGKNYTPKNYYSGYRGAMTMRDAIAISSNIPHVKALSKIGVDNSIKFCKSVGITNLGSEGLSLALGGLTYGTTALNMAGAYSAIANNGVYIEPTFYSKVVDSDGNTYMECKPIEQRSNRVMSEQNAYIEKNILETVVTRGTATYCSIPGMSVSAKTGTTNNDNDRWLCGFTPYYTAACWFGYEYKAKVYYDGNPAGQIWAAIMKNIHNGLPSKTFDRPSGLVDVCVCKDTGKVATQACSNKYMEIFREGNVPSYCDGHKAVNICNETGLIANDKCPNVTTINYPNILEQEASATWTTVYGNSGVAPTKTCTSDHNTNQTPDSMVELDLVPPTSDNQNNNQGTNQSTTETQTPSTTPPQSNDTTQNNPQTPSNPPTSTNTTNPPAQNNTTKPSNPPTQNNTTKPSNPPTQTNTTNPPAQNNTTKPSNPPTQSNTTNTTTPPASTNTATP